MSDALLQSILGHSLIVGFITIIITLAAFCGGIVCEIEGWRKSMAVFKSIIDGSLIIAAICAVVMVAVGVCILGNDLYCNLQCA